MKNLLILFIVCYSITPFFGQEGITFFKGDFEAAKKQAAKEHKLIFLDAYTTWCGPCKRMARTTFKDKAVGEFYNSNFINLKVDMEKGEGPKLARKFSVNAYPTLLFIDADGTLVHVERGARNAKDFNTLGLKVLKKNDKSDAYAKQYEAGDRSTDFLSAYIYSLKRAQKDYNKLLNAYINAAAQPLDTNNLQLLFDCMTEADSKTFSLLTEYTKALRGIYSKEDFETKIKLVCDNTVYKSIEYKTPDLLEVAQKQFKRMLPKQAKSYKVSSQLLYAKNTGNLAQVIKYGKKSLKKYFPSNPDKHIELATFVLKNHTDPKQLQEAKKWSTNALKLQYNAASMTCHIRILYALGEKNEAARMEAKLKSIK